MIHMILQIPNIWMWRILFTAPVQLLTIETPGVSPTTGRPDVLSAPGTLGEGSLAYHRSMLNHALSKRRGVNKVAMLELHFKGVDQL